MTVCVLSAFEGHHVGIIGNTYVGSRQCFKIKTIDNHLNQLRAYTSFNAIVKYVKLHTWISYDEWKKSSQQYPFNSFSAKKTIISHEIFLNFVTMLNVSIPSALYIYLLLDINNGGQFRIKLYTEGDNFSFPTVHFSFLWISILAAPMYGVYISNYLHYYRPSISYHVSMMYSCCSLESYST